MEDNNEKETKYEEEPYEILEREFEIIFKAHHAEIQSKLEAAYKLINEATAISEEYGIPFRPKFEMPFRMSYIPDSFKNKFPILDVHELSGLTDAHGSKIYSGWQTSQTC